MHRIVLGIVLLFPLACAQASSCFCSGDGPVCQHFFHTDTVFLGTVLRKEALRTLLHHGREIPIGMDLLVQVNVAFRGMDDEEVRIRRASGCGIGIEAGGTYLFFASRDQDGELTIDTCLSRPIAEAGDALAEIGALLAGAPSSITGSVMQTRRDVLNDRTEETRAMAAARVWVESSEGRSYAVTGEDGQFAFSGLAPGKYRVGMEPPRDVDPAPDGEPTQVDLVEGGCSIVDFVAQPAGRVEGSLKDSRGKPVRHAAVTLMPAEVAPEEEINEYSGTWGWTDPEGRWNVPNVPAGKYVIVVNLERDRPKDLPIPTTYYPGVRDRTQARTIALKEGEVVGGIDLRLNGLYMSDLLAVVRWEDGTPAKDVAVGLYWRDDDEPDSFFDGTHQTGEQGEDTWQVPSDYVMEAAASLTCADGRKVIGRSEPVTTGEDPVAAVVILAGAPCARDYN